MSAGGPLAERLVALIGDRLPGARDITVSEPQRVGGGLSTENWLFDAAWTAEGGERQAQALVLRCSSASEIVDATRTDEFALLCALQGSGVPAPRALWLDGDGRWIGRPAMVIARCAGRAERGLLGERNTLGLDRPARRCIAEQMTDALSALHRVDVATVAHLPAADGPPALRELARLDAQIARAGLGGEPELVLADRWLRAHLPSAPAREVVVHADFRPANVLVDGGRLSAVLDWELAHRGDPAEDLGWVLAPVYRHEHFIAGAWTPADFLARYAQQSGIAPDPAAFGFWSVFALYKLSVIALVTMASLAAGDHARLGPPPHRLIELLMRALFDTPEPQR